MPSEWRGSNVRYATRASRSYLTVDRINFVPFESRMNKRGIAMLIVYHNYSLKASLSLLSVERRFVETQKLTSISLYHKKFM